MGIAGGNIYLDFFYSALVEFPAALILILTIDRIGRRYPWAAANLVAGFACLITAFVPDCELLKLLLVYVTVALEGHIAHSLSVFLFWRTEKTFLLL